MERERGGGGENEGDGFCALAPERERREGGGGGIETGGERARGREVGREGRCAEARLFTGAFVCSPKSQVERERGRKVEIEVKTERARENDARGETLCDYGRV